MKKDFEIGQGTEIIKNGKIYDLHNLYDFIGVFLKTKDRRLQLSFEPNSEYGKGQSPVLLSFEEIDYLEFSLNFGTRIISALDEMGYKNPEDRNDRWLMDEQQATSNDHFFLRMDGGDFVRVHSKSANFVVATKLTSIKQ